MVGFAFFPREKPGGKLAWREPRHWRKLPTSSTALQAIRTYVFFIAGTVPVQPLGVCERWCRERSHCCTTKCINSGAKPAYCAAKHINNEADATNNAVVPRARR